MIHFPPAFDRDPALAPAYGHSLDLQLALASDPPYAPPAGLLAAKALAAAAFALKLGRAS